MLERELGRRLRQASVTILQPASWVRSPGVRSPAKQYGQKPAALASRSSLRAVAQVISAPDPRRPTHRPERYPD